MKIKKIKFIMSLILLAVITVTAAAKCDINGEIEKSETEETDNMEKEKPKETGNIIEAEIEKAGGEDVGSLTSLELVHKISAGWNLGNTFDAHWNGRPWGTINSPQEQETMWGNPVTTKEMIDKIKESGFNTVRIPVTWYIFTGPGPDYKIGGELLDRVQEVVDYVIQNGMFCILNIHHDDYKSGDNWECGWLTLYHIEEDGGSRPFTDSEKQEFKNRMGKLWEQIAKRFEDYDEHLIFEALNEPRTEGLNNITKEIWAEQCNFLNAIQQTFVDTIRAGRGKNPDRHLMVTPYFASVGMDTNDGEGRIGLFVDKETGKLKINDPRDRLIASVHYYEPWGFVTAPDDSEWFSWYFDLKVGSVSSNLNNVLKILDKYFVSNNIPTIMGETGAIFRTMPDGNSNEAEIIKWADYYIVKLKELGIPSIIWDDGGSFKLLDRNNLEWLYPDYTNSLVKAGQTPVK
ncbi:MAG: glycoside hydrolase family 5 protein [Oscillospiraceae bacterium]|nr:glycoside hydrolase family 5 protein [Oscillospiraceae bacterium]